MGRPDTQQMDVYRMTDDEVAELLTKLGARRLAAWQRGEPGFELPEDAPSGIENDICALLWYVGSKPSRGDLLAAGATSEQIAAAMIAQKATLGIFEPSDLVPLPHELAQEIDADLRAALLDEPEESLRHLDEKVVDWITEYRVEIYFNEGQHRGRPHVAVVLPDGKVSVRLENSPVLLTPHGYRGEASALKVVKKHLQRLRKLWDDTRPDDQKLPPREKADLAQSKAREPKRRLCRP
jgi:hypothetical protein